MVHLEVASDYNSDISDKTSCALLHFCASGVHLPLINKHAYRPKVTKLLYAHVSRIQALTNECVDASAKNT
jgi:hypothetical protein